MSETKLKPCPFCGGEGMLAMIGYGEFYVQCENCGACNGVYSDSQEAIKFWNKRYEPRNRVYTPARCDRLKRE